MDLAITSETALMSNKDCFRNIWGLPQLTVPGTILVSTMTEASHFPNGFVPPGTLLGRFTAGANAGYLAPYFNDWSDATNTGLDTPAAMVWDGFYLNRNAAGAYSSTVVAGSVLLAGTVVQVILSKLPPNYDEDGTSAHTIVAADLPANFIAVNLGTSV